MPRCKPEGVNAAVQTRGSCIWYKLTRDTKQKFHTSVEVALALSEKLVHNSARQCICLQVKKSGLQSTCQARALTALPWCPRTLAGFRYPAPRPLG